jgi:YD repeat-containing protein
MTWERDHFKVQYRDGSSATYLPCNDFTCFWTGSRDAAGNMLTIQRDPARGLLQVFAGDRQGIGFQPDAEHRIAQASDTASNTVKYEYDADGCLARIHRPDGRIIVYEYDEHHHMTRVSVINAPGEQAQTLVINEYDPAGHLVKETLADGSQYEIKYLAFAGMHASQLTVREPSGRFLHFSLSDEDYHEWTTPVRFPRVSNR